MIFELNVKFTQKEKKIFKQKIHHGFESVASFYISETDTVSGIHNTKPDYEALLIFEISQSSDGETAIMNLLVSCL